jgi:hypothetical protein
MSTHRLVTLGIDKSCQQVVTVSVKAGVARKVATRRPHTDMTTHIRCSRSRTLRGPRHTEHSRPLPNQIPALRNLRSRHTFVAFSHVESRGEVAELDACFSSQIEVGI